ncbi:MAG: CopG family transcriptional regulator [Candidatus Bathyarchaeota archaeon]
MEKSAKSNVTTVSIPTVLAEKIKKKCEGTGFNSVSSYVTYVLRQVLSSYPGSGERNEAFSERDREEIKERLRRLGYLN